jgi:hypothetical protein
MGQYLTELVHRRPDLWSRDVNEMYDLLESHGHQSLLKAVAVALQQQLFGVGYVAAHLPGNERGKPSRSPRPAVSDCERRSGCLPALPYPPHAVQQTLFEPMEDASTNILPFGPKR